MKISILTLFPEMFAGPFDYSIIKRARTKKILQINLVNLRPFGKGRHKQVDDRPYGGGVGMIMRVDVLDKAIQSSKLKIQSASWRTKFKERVVLLDPKGKLFNQKIAQQYSRLNHLILVSGHYEGVDERVKKLVDEVISIGDYILTGGELASAVIVDAVARLLPGVLTKWQATAIESFKAQVLEYPQYTRPPIYQGLTVPRILLSGNHQKIANWRTRESLKQTKKLRPDLLRKPT